MKKSLTLLMLFALNAFCFAQDGEAPNYANSALLPPGAAEASKMSNASVNLFTGQAAMSIPIYSYKSNNGLALSVSLEYTGGNGIRVGEAPSITGLGWSLSAGGCITRTVRGLPDDMPTYGFLYASAIPTDFRSNANKYYHDSIDTQEDIFQFSFPGHSGRFYFGKNGQIVVAPLSKMRVIPTYLTVGYQTLKSFRIIAENGVKYDFEDMEGTVTGVSTSFFPSGYSPTLSYYYGKQYGTTWQLTRIISPFNADTIKFHYEIKTLSYAFKLPQITFVNNSTGVRKTPTLAPGYGSTFYHKLDSIELPDKTVIDFIYNKEHKYSADDYALSKIKIKDSILRFAYLLDYQESYVTGHGGGRSGHTYTYLDSTRLLLKAVIPYTKTEKQAAYEFDYNYPLFPRLSALDDSIQNKRDHWGFYNGAVNGDTLIPNISPYTWGANRNPSTAAEANSLLRAYLPTGGYVQYAYEPNDHYPYVFQKNSITLNPPTASQNTLILNQVYSSHHKLVFLLDKSVVRTGSTPISGSGNLDLAIKNSAGTTTYLTTSFSLSDLFYTGLKSWEFSLPNNTYRIDASVSSGTTISGSFPIDIKWENKTDTTISSQTSGGIRVAGMARVATNQQISSESYRYVLENGKSSGFFGDVPIYDYPFREIVNYGGTTTTDYTAVCSEPMTPVDYVQGNTVGYSRIEIVRDSYAGTLGKEVQEFTNLSDLNTNSFVPMFPFVPYDLRNWGLGMIKKILLYDSAGNLVKKTVNNFSYDTVIYNSDNFKSLKLGHSRTTYNGNPLTPSTPKVKEFIGEHYYLTNGRIYLTSTYDTLFQTNGTKNTSYQQFVYDTNYNVSKIITGYDRNRSLTKEQRFYYPYNYSTGGGVGKLRDSAIITLPVCIETWIDGDSNPRISDGTITAYKQITSGEVKPDSIFSLITNKPIPQSTITVFDATKLNRNTTYFKPQMTFVSYDAKGNLSELKNIITGQSSSIIVDYDQQYTIANVTNAAQSDIAYTSFESTGSGNWTVPSTSRDLVYSLTGKKSYNLSNGNVTKTGLNSSQNYLLTIWVKPGASVSVNSTAVSGAIASQNGWSLYSIPLSGISSITISGSGQIDELRLHPKNSNMSTTAYEPLIGVISAADANNSVAYSEYDNLNRIHLIRDKDKNIIKRFKYSDSAMLISTAPIYVNAGTQCEDLNPGVVDTLVKDTNPFSDTYGEIVATPLPGYNCSCPNATGPQFQIINGVCEKGTWCVSSSVRKKINNVFVWECTHRYVFSDGSLSTYYELSYHDSSCALTCNTIIDP